MFFVKLSNIFLDSYWKGNNDETRSKEIEKISYSSKLIQNFSNLSNFVANAKSHKNYKIIF